MVKSTRQQLSLFVSKTDAEEIEAIREKFNPLQRELIDCHVTLCREDEIEDIEKALSNLENLRAEEIRIQFGQAIRFDNGKGVLIPGAGRNEEFHQLRETVLKGAGRSIKLHEPHITLMHPRNSTCTDETYDIIQTSKLPSYLRFNTISLIEQVDGGRWIIINSFGLTPLKQERRNTD